MNGLLQLLGNRLATQRLNVEVVGRSGENQERDDGNFAVTRLPNTRQCGLTGEQVKRETERMSSGKMVNIEYRTTRIHIVTGETCVPCDTQDKCGSTIRITMLLT